MTSPALYYPEFDSVEIEETISPLAEFDREILSAVHKGGAHRAASVGEARASAAEWADRSEDYPFQRVIRTMAASLAEREPISSFLDSPAVWDLFDDPRTALHQILGRAESRLRETCTRALVAAVNHAREKGLLTGTDPAERYASFVERATRTSFAEAGGVDFPVLHGVVPTILRNEADSIMEMCCRLGADRRAIAAAFGIAETDRIVSLGLSEGDTHHHGRSVSVVRFASGKHLVYKPRDVSCEAAYERLAGELNRRLGTRLVAAAVLKRDGYGYVEFIDTEDVSDRSGDFMEASGELAAVLYLLNARDMHFENIVPTRRGPVPIDLETILHPARIHRGPTPEAPGNAFETIAQSVYGIGILPLVMVGKKATAGHVDLGFLGDQGQGNSPFKSMQFEEPFTDRVRLVLREQEAQPRRTVVSTLTEDEVHALGERMTDGFTRVFRAVLEDRETFAGLLRETVADVRVRYVHNPTVLYAQTMRMTSGARALADHDVYAALLKRVAIPSKTSDRQIVRSEMRQLAERDIPYFTVASTSVVLQDGDGAEVASFPESPLERALAKVRAMTEFDLQEQLRLIHSAFACRFPDNHLAAALPAAPDTERAGTAPGAGSDPCADGTAAALAARLCDRLIASSLPDKYAHLPRTWIGPLASAQVGRPWPPTVLGYDLYTGRVGPALALAAAGRVLGRDDYREQATQIFSTTADILARERYEKRSIEQAGFAGYTGMAGILFALTAAGRLLDRDDWVSAAQGAVPLVLGQLRALPQAELPLDVISGVAGVLSCVAEIGGEHGAQAVAELTSLLTAGLPRDGREPAGPARAALEQSGYAHGIAGLLHVLCRAHPLLPADGRPAVESAAAYLAGRLDGFFDRAENNWFSNVATPTSFSTGWCHGATGISLALDAYAGLSGDPDAARKRDMAVGNLLRHGFGRNLTWCHGDLGNHDALTALAARTQDPVLREARTAVEDRWLRPEVFERKLADTRSRYAHTSSLMVGWAGVVLHLVHRLDPTVRVSPVTLTVEGR
ncbi:type 2 lanthipeptide synthetase LanM family protein [Streptomyces regalis]|uniref:Lantibiotic biosynthesis protein dehydration domain-containing protein n=1 Tax=Streptomyces regalis TaxID=68262 RepID=A0A101JHQ7_9ACTN|nr:type 2 lanthipeptide synthetase LanM family protein [Streptomyces regalis]KUL26661.1 hypothetical protein ADL12_32425 [Streptomyces regalis]